MIKIEGRKSDDRGWDGWMASPTQWTWVWASSRSWWWTGKPGVLQSMGSQRVGHDSATELNWTMINRWWVFFPLFLRSVVCISFISHTFIFQYVSAWPQDRSKAASQKAFPLPQKSSRSVRKSKKSVHSYPTMSVLRHWELNEDSWIKWGPSGWGQKHPPMHMSKYPLMVDRHWLAPNNEAKKKFFQQGKNQELPIPNMMGNENSI